MVEETKEKVGKKKKKSSKSTMVIVGLMVAGIAIMLYPVISNLYNEVTGSHAIQEFHKTLEERSAEELETERENAEAYNRSLLDTQEEPEGVLEYEEILNFGKGMMGYIEIPKIEVYLPIYHGVSEEVLSKGVGHISRTAFPIGGEGNHSVLTGHTGSPSAKLFTDLDQLEEGDTFYVHVMENTFAYEVDQILVVLPEEVDDIQPVAGMDYCTLVTCTPYGINSHRLLVRGHRVAFEGTEEAAQTGISVEMILLLVVLAAGITGFVVWRVQKKKKIAKKAKV